MSDPLSVIASSLTCLHACVKALVIIGKARSFSQDVSDVQFRTTLILHSLTTWAQEAGLTQEPPILLVNANDAPLVPGILCQLDSLFSDIHELKVRYGSYLQQTDGEVDPGDDEGTVTLNVDTQRRKWSERIDVAIYLKRKQPWRRLKWVSLDDEKFDRLLGKAKGYVNELGKFLEQARRDRMEAHVEFYLRNTILKADGRRLSIIRKEYQEPNANLAISAAAKLKQTRLSLGISESRPVTSRTSVTISPPSSPTLTTRDIRAMEDMRLSMRLLTLGKAERAMPLRTLAWYDGRVILLEWKYVIDMNDSNIAKRVNQVAALLHDLGPTLHSLQCRGFVKDHVAKRYGYVFELPDELSPSPRRPQFLQNGISSQPNLTTQLLSLRQMLDQSTRPSLNIRLSLAVTLIETLLNLHTSGWLHKEFRSDNIIFIRTVDSTSDTDKNDLSTYSVYIAGYVYSRLDSPGEVTEPLQSELEADLYRHPALLSDTHQPYRKSFDIFSVGCTLLEIGLWANLRQILEQHSGPRLGTEPSRIAERTKLTPVIAHNQEPNDTGGETHAASNSRPALDLMALKRELLPVRSAGQSARFATKPSTTTPSFKGVVSSEIRDSLEAATGKRYTTIVEELLATGSVTETEGSFTDEHESALDLEMMARDVVRAIADAI